MVFDIGRQKIIIQILMLLMSDMVGYWGSRNPGVDRMYGATNHKKSGIVHAPGAPRFRHPGDKTHNV
jgi:hypothetical protein